MTTQTIQTPINYWLDPKLGGFETYVPGTVGYHFDRKFSPAIVTVQDIRGREASYSIENQGFQLLRDCPPIKVDGADSELIKTTIYAQTEDLIKRT